MSEPEADLSITCHVVHLLSPEDVEFTLHSHKDTAITILSDEDNAFILPEAKAGASTPSNEEKASTLLLCGLGVHSSFT